MGKSLLDTRAFTLVHDNGKAQIIWRWVTSIAVEGDCIVGTSGAEATIRVESFSPIDVTKPSKSIKNTNGVEHSLEMRKVMNIM